MSDYPGEEHKKENEELSKAACGILKDKLKVIEEAAKELEYSTNGKEFDEKGHPLKVNIDVAKSLRETAKGILELTNAFYDASHDVFFRYLNTEEKASVENENGHIYRKDFALEEYLLNGSNTPAYIFRMPFCGGRMTKAGKNFQLPADEYCMKGITEAVFDFKNRTGDFPIEFKKVFVGFLHHRAFQRKESRKGAVDMDNVQTKFIIDSLNTFFFESDTEGWIETAYMSAFTEDKIEDEYTSVYIAGMENMLLMAAEMKKASRYVILPGETF